MTRFYVKMGTKMTRKWSYSCRDCLAESALRRGRGVAGGVAAENGQNIAFYVKIRSRSSSEIKWIENIEATVERIAALRA